MYPKQSLKIKSIGILELFVVMYSFKLAPYSAFLEINTPTNEILKRDKYLKDYQSLL
jgi:hypothetical protein